jgi:hypothetical protein
MRNDRNMTRHRSKRLVLYCIILIAVSATVSGICLRLISYELQIRAVIAGELNYDELRNIRIKKSKLDRIRDYANDLIMSNPDFKEHPYMNEIGYLTFAMMLSDYDMIKGRVPDKSNFLRGIGRVSRTKKYQELYNCYRAIFADIEYFPVPNMRRDAHRISYEDSWLALRSYGGYRGHEGTDIVAGNNLPGYFPIISITDGVVENLGWLEQGGNRIGIRSKSGGYFYYAHLDSYAPELKQGDTVVAGQLLGFMGDSGYGPEGTKGQFDVHLHLGIYVTIDNIETSVNPYWILRFLEYSRTELLY